MNKKEVKVCSLLIAIFSLRIFGLMMIVPVLPVYLHTLDSDNSVFLGLIIGIYGFTQALLQIPLGYLSDIVGRKKVIFGGLLMLCFGSFIAYLAQSAYLMILGRAIQGAGAIGSTILAAISDHTSEKNRTLAMAFLGASVGISFFLSLIIGPVVASKFGLKAIFALIMALTFLALLLLVLLLPNAPAKPNRENSPVKHMLTRVFYNSGLASMYFSIFLLHFVYTSLFIELPAILVSSLNLTVESHWLFYAKTILLSLVFLIPALYYAEKKAVTKELIVVAIFTFFLSFFVLTFYNQSHLLITAIVTLFFAGFSFLESVLPSLTSKCSPVALRGTAMGIFSSCQFLGIFLGGLIAGFFQEYFGQQAYFFFVSFLLLIWFFTSKGLSIGDFSECSFDFDYRDRSFFRGIKNELSHLNGVIKVFYVKDEKKIYIKFDNSITSSAELKQNISLYVNRL